MVAYGNLFEPDFIPNPKKDTYALTEEDIYVAW